MSLLKQKLVLDLPKQGIIESPTGTTNAYSFENDFSEFNTQSIQKGQINNTSDNEIDMISMNPVLVNNQSGVIKLTTNVGFTNMTCDTNCQNNVVNWNFHDVISAIPEYNLKNQMKMHDPSFAVPLSLKVLGTSLGDLENYFSLQVMDNSSPQRPLHSVTAFKLNSSDQVYSAGYPLYLMKTGLNLVLLKSGEFNHEHLAYWSLNMDMLEKDISLIHMPGKTMENVIIKKDSQAAYMANYALSIKNQMVVPPLLENPAYTYAIDADYIMMPKNLYQDVKDAYKNKMDEVKEGSYDFSNISFRLVPLPGVPQSKLEQIENAYVSLEIIAHMGLDIRTQMEPESVEQENLSNGLFETFMAEM